MEAKQRFQSFEEYLSYDDGTENLYELFNGELILVPPESGKNTAIAVLLLKFAAIVGHLRVRPHGLELEVRGEPRNRYPELTIIRAEHVQQLDRRSTLLLSMAPPLLVIEIVSPPELQRDRDYIAKRSQYQERGIPEYWVVNPQIETVLVLKLTETVYVEVGTFCGSDRIRSSLVGELNLTALHIFAAGS